MLILEVDSTEARSADEHEHRRPQVAKRNATTNKESTPIVRWEREARREIKKRCQNECFETAYFYLPESGFRANDLSNGGGRWIALAYARAHRFALSNQVFRLQQCFALSGFAVLSNHLKIKNAPVEVRFVFKWWWEVDSNHRKRC